MLLRPLGALLPLSGLGGRCDRFGCDQVKQRLLQHLTRFDERVGSVTNEFDVAVQDTTIGCTHADITANPCREEQEAPVQQVPLRRPWQGDIIHAEGLDLGGQPGKDTDDENHREHHGFHGTHLDLELLGHHLLLKGHGLFLQDGVS